MTQWLSEVLARRPEVFADRLRRFLLGHPLKIAVILVVAFVISRVASRAARRFVLSMAQRSPLHRASTRAEGRAETLGGVLAQIARMIVWAIALLGVIDELGFNLGPLLAGASVVGVALGFGAQSLVKDFLAGFFILVEDQYGVGDVVTIDDVTGTVEEISLRVTRLRSQDGTVWFIPNGELKKVGNANKDWAVAVVDAMIDPDSDVGAARAVFTEEANKLADDPNWSHALLDRPDVWVESIGAEEITLRSSVRTHPVDKARVARELRSRVIDRLHPHRTEVRG